MRYLVDDFLDKYKNEPVKFCKSILNMKLIWEGQRTVLESIKDHKRTSVASGHSTAKSATAAAITLWWLSTRVKSRVLVTAPTFRQLMTVYYAEVNKWYNNSLLKPLGMFNLMSQHMTVADPELKKEWYMLPVSPKTPDALQGQHGDKSEDVKNIMKSLGIDEIDNDADLKTVIEALKAKKNIEGGSQDELLVIIDEGSGVGQEVLEVLEGTDYTRLVIFGNMTKTTGMFYDSMYRSKGQFNPITLSSYDSPFMSYEQINYLEKRYGKDSNVVRVRLKGLPPDSEDDTIIPRELLETYIEATIDPDKELDDSVIDIGYDVARFGDDTTVIYERRGSYIQNQYFYRKKDTMHSAGVIARIAKENSNTEVTAKVDVVGVGGGPFDRLQEQGIRNLTLIEVHNNGTAINDEEYADTITELFFTFLEKLKAGCVSIPDDPELIEDLAGRKYGFDSKGRLKVESKDDFKKRFKRSPDKGDGFLQCWGDNNRGGSHGIII